MRPAAIVQDCRDLYDNAHQIRLCERNSAGWGLTAPAHNGTDLTWLWVTVAVVVALALAAIIVFLAYRRGQQRGRESAAESLARQATGKTQ